jgi:hypothetical protein
MGTCAFEVVGRGGGPTDDRQVKTWQALSTTCVQLLNGHAPESGVVAQMSRVLARMNLTDERSSDGTECHDLMKCSQRENAHVSGRPIRGGENHAPRSAGFHHPDAWRPPFRPAHLEVPAPLPRRRRQPRAPVGRGRGERFRPDPGRSSPRTSRGREGTVTRRSAPRFTAPPGRARYRRSARPAARAGRPPAGRTNTPTLVFCEMPIT